MQPAPPTDAAPARVQSLDVFRGGTIAAMILVNNGTSQSYPPLRHAPWHGWTFTDLVFPFFLWIVGVSLTLSLRRRVGRGDDRRTLMLHVARRAIVIFLLGLFLNGFPGFALASIRIPGVLQRIAICYFAAAALYLFVDRRGLVLWLIGLLASYWGLMTFFPVPGYGAGVMDVPGNFAWYIDGLLLPGHMYSQTLTWDPEGVVSTLPAIATALFGVLAGELLGQRMAMERTCSWLFFSGSLLLFTGAMMSTWLPINKPIWTSSYSVFTAGLAFILFACCYWMVDVSGWRRFARPFSIYGMNALAMFVLSGLFARVLGLIRWTGADGNPVSLRSAIFGSVFVPLGPPDFAAFLFALAHVLLFYAIAYGMHRRGWFVRV